MNRIFFIVLFIGFSSLLFGQQSPIIGYDKMEWGTTVEAFQKMYPSAKEIPSEKSSIGVREFKQADVGAGISSRTFEFFNNRFYSANVSYKDLTINSVNALLDRIVEIYGKFDEREEETDFPPNVPKNLTMLETTTFFMKYRNNFNIQFLVFKIFFLNGAIKYEVSILYNNPIIVREVLAAEKKQAGSKLGL